MKWHLSPLIATLLALAGVGCTPKTTDPEQLRAMHEQNETLRQDINRMQALIEQAGEDVPGLTEQIAAAEVESAARIKELDALDARETQLRLRAIELQDRLDAFRASFRMMQSEIANSRRS
ncbi:MAG: hypothetical protein ACI4OS_02630 [Akkermansia sp.]